jgi:alpha/beta superfamily hydrolase
MDNKVVTTVARALRATGIPAVRFNFRGVGASAGSFDDGIGETADADAVAAWGSAHWPGRSLVIAGFSFGGSIALRVAQQWEARGRAPKLLFTIAPAIERVGAFSMPLPRCPWTVLQGDADEVVDPASVAQWANALEPKPRLVILAGAGHFFHGRLSEVRDAVIDAVRSG